MTEPEEEDFVVPDFIPLRYTLPSAASIRSCPACAQRLYSVVVDDSTGDTILDGEEGMKVEYHYTGIVGAPCGERFSYDELKELGPHVCKMCPVCDYGWSEQVRKSHGC